MAVWVLAASAGRAAAADDLAELAGTLQHGFLLVPEDFARLAHPEGRLPTFKEVAAQLERVGGGRRLPVIIYLHGCAGVGSHGRAAIRLFAENRFAVVAPDSFARRAKPTSCDPETRTWGIHRGVLAWRIAEAKHAYDWVIQQSWADRKRIFVGGFSEGGIAAAKYYHGGLAGRFVLGWTCHGAWSEYVGIAGPAGEPIFAAVADKDPWFGGSAVGNCGGAMVGRPNSVNVVLDWDYHPVLFHEAVQERLLVFLRKNRAK